MSRTEIIVTEAYMPKLSEISYGTIFVSPLNNNKAFIKTSLESVVSLNDGAIFDNEDLDQQVIPVREVELKL